jgi:gliding motility-associatede transport system auxiliary component
MKIDRQEIFKMAGLLGPALLIAGYVRYSVQETMGKLNLAILIAGGLLSLIGLIFNFRAIREATRRRSTRLGANTTVMTVAVVAIIGLANFLGYRHHKRIDLTTDKLYSLSDQTRKIVSDLKKDVKVTLFDKDDQQGLAEQMKEYRNLSSRFSFERIDPQKNLEAAKQYKITQLGEVVVACGDRTERPKDTTEQSLINAIIKVTRDSLKKIYFVEGHGEKRLSSTNEGDGYGVVDKMLKDENYETKTVNLVSSNDVPSDCDVLVLAGPKQSLFPQEASEIGKYLEGGGKAMLLIDPDTDPKLEDILRTWGIELGNNTVVDVSGVGRLFQLGPGAPLARTYGSHPITKDFEGTMTFFPISRSVDTIPGSNATTTDLFKTSPESWAETDLKSPKGIQFDEGQDTRGPITLGVAATRHEGDKEARLVVIGDSDFAENQYVGVQRNGDLFINSINWLAQDEDLISIRPKNPADRRVTMTEADQNMLFWVTLVLMPLATIGSGVYIWWKRR